MTNLDYSWWHSKLVNISCACCQQVCDIWTPLWSEACSLQKTLLSLHSRFLSSQRTHGHQVTAANGINSRVDWTWRTDLSLFVCPNMLFLSGVLLSVFCGIPHAFPHPPQIVSKCATFRGLGADPWCWCVCSVLVDMPQGPCETTNP